MRPHVRQIELCAAHCEIVIARERGRGIETSDRRYDLSRAEAQANTLEVSRLLFSRCVASDDPGLKEN
jgi:hypothetical protein